MQRSRCGFAQRQRNATIETLEGQKIGNYVVSELLGEGSMGTVYLAEHPEIGRRVAVKILSSHLTLRAKTVERFIAEARAVARIKHPNVVDIYDFGRTEDGQIYYVMELLRGRELNEIMGARGRMNPADVLPYVEQICAALFAAHQQGVVHRDLKPQNIYVLDGEPLSLKLLDFGIAKIIEAEREGPQLTTSGMVIGTPLTISPEQAAGKREMVGPQTDLYSLGIILYWMLAGRPPFYELPSAVLLAKHISEDPPPLRELAPSVPPAVAQIVHCCLEKLPQSRPASAYDVALVFAEHRNLLGSTPLLDQSRVFSNSGLFRLAEGTCLPFNTPEPIPEVRPSPSQTFDYPALTEEANTLVGLKRISSTIARNEPTRAVVRQILELCVELASGQSAALCIDAEQVAAITQEVSPPRELPLGDRALLVSEGPLAEEVRDWEGTADPLLSSDGARLILPQPKGGVIIAGPGAQVLSQTEKATALQVLADLAMGEVHRATKFAEAEHRAVALQETRRRLREQNALLRELAVVDELTGLHNRRFFERRLSYEIERFLRYERPLSLVLIDVDWFKRINDTYGHQIGDQVLRYLADTFKERHRRVDLVARYGGEEFAVLMPDTGLAGAETAAERLREQVSQTPLQAGEEEISLTISAGVAAAEGEWSGDSESLFRAADQALYRAKEGGRNKVVTVTQKQEAAA